MMAASTLAKLQSNLLDSIFNINNIAIEAINTPAKAKLSIKNRGLQTYQANAGHAALRSLQAAYPVVAQLIGDKVFAHLATDYWAKYPPVRGDLAQWGSELPAFITSIQALQTEPYLSDVAKVEWALHIAATAPDKAVDLASFALLTAHEPDTLTLQLATGIALIHSEYPVASILTAHLYDSPSFDDVGQKLRQNSPEIALVWRQALRPMVGTIGPAEAVFLTHLLAGESLLASLNSALSATLTTDVSTPFDFATWLSQAVTKGLVLGAKFINCPLENP